jgi:hypothetical protein
MPLFIVPVLYAAALAIGEFLVIWAARVIVVDKIVSVIEKFVTSDEFIDLVTRGIGPFIAEHAAEKWGIQLDPNDPFTKESLNNAIVVKTGIPFSDIFDREAVVRDAGAWVTEQVNLKLGTDFENLLTADTDDLKANFEAQVMAQVNAGLNGSSSMFSQDAINMVADAVASSRGLVLDPDRVPPSEEEQQEIDARKLSARLASRKHYRKQRETGYKRGWIATAAVNPQEPEP